MKKDGLLSARSSQYFNRAACSTHGRAGSAGWQLQTSGGCLILSMKKRQPARTLAADFQFSTGGWLAPFLVAGPSNGGLFLAVHQFFHLFWCVFAQKTAQVFHNLCLVPGQTRGEVERVQVVQAIEEALPDVVLHKYKNIFKKDAYG